MNEAFPCCAGSRMNVMMRTQRVAYFTMRSTNPEE